MAVPHVEALHKLAGLDGAARSTATKELSELTQKLIDTTGRGLILTEADLSNLDLRGVDLRKATLNRAVLHGTVLEQADLRQITMVCPGMERTNMSNANLRGAYVHALAAQTCNFSGADLSSLRDATGTLFHGCNMRGTRFPGSQLAGTSFYQCDLTESSFARANLQGSLINECLLDDAEFDAASVDQLTVTKSSMRRTSLRDASGRGLVLQRLTGSDGLVLAGADLPRLRLDRVRGNGWQATALKAVDADLAGVAVAEIDLRAADLSGARVRDSSLLGADLSGAILNDGKISHSCLRDAKLVGACGENLHVVESDLAGSDLSAFIGRCFTARDVDMSGVRLCDANLYRAMITGDPPKGMSLRGADLENATLIQAYVAADLRGARLTGANCAYSRFSQSDLSDANLDGASMYQSTWIKVATHGATMAGLKAPIFVDRCPGLTQAIEKTGGDTTDEFLAFLERLAGALSVGRKGST